MPKHLIVPTFALLVLVLFVFHTPVASATGLQNTWYVAPDGDDSTTCTTPAIHCKKINGLYMTIGP